MTTINDEICEDNFSDDKISWFANITKFLATKLFEAKIPPGNQKKKFRKTSTV